ncbi:DUF300-domain-containing protein [Suhomyces tanzawaensis NRRL Y-17324]|uniref:DUF300-domain-containing protein n=1 Tax=Suhomyces tanzawaensis NRRL Y-17324 TaxID=984487 RepID=A0A1E4SBL7_9ASCO|nr:DUF300-domain-containing protein [Suhomyces tanzawaensis NRRL Y-17324]ODV76891.1 DUF300-domain-containing protein [Suhomyces tanzawaensis NRRL Y-17324]
MASASNILPSWIISLSLFASIISTLIIFLSIYMHLRNYRKPFEQRLMIRIQLIVPLFALSCYSMLTNQTSLFNRIVLEPVREVYEAFVIYTFFSLLTDMLGGERSIIIKTSGREPVAHPGLLRYVLPPLDISDSFTFLGIKRGILQYVWLKPFICFATVALELWGVYDVKHIGPGSLYFWMTLLYNASVTLSLYCLAIFWKILWNDLKPFNPVGKFLCVKLIIFASYWQGVILAILSAFHLLPAKGEESSDESIGLCIQNALLCVELIAFAIGHWYSFSYVPYTIAHIPNGRLIFRYAFKDMIGVKDLWYDFRLTFYGDYYKDYKQFDSVEALIAHPDSKGRMSKINQGLRYHFDGKQKHWLPSDTLSTKSIAGDVRSTSETAVSNSSQLPHIHYQSKDYAPSLKSSGASTRGLYSASTRSQNSPSPSTEFLAEPEVPPQTITDIIKSDPLLASIDYEDERFDEDEQLYQIATVDINNYNLNLNEVKRLLNYPIVDELIHGHAYGFKVQKLRRDRLKNLARGLEESILQANTESNRYGSVV